MRSYSLSWSFRWWASVRESLLSAGQLYGCNNKVDFNIIKEGIQGIIFISQKSNWKIYANKPKEILLHNLTKYDFWYFSELPL